MAEKPIEQRARQVASIYRFGDSSPNLGYRNLHLWVGLSRLAKNTTGALMLIPANVHLVVAISSGDSGRYAAAASAGYGDLF